MNESERLSALLLDWYDSHARALPWRGSRDPYRVWLSEIMLQQTRTRMVEQHYHQFLERFPDVFALAEAPLDEVLKQWEGMGYYSRARNLHAAAKQIAASGGQLPDSVEGLQALPGVGPYVARAVAAIAFGIPAPVLDGNQMRVLSRVFAVERLLKTPFDLEPEAMSCLSRARPGDYNQALMDLGASVCFPRYPDCKACPLSPICLAREQGDPARYPLRPAPVTKRVELRTVFLIELPGGVAIRRRSEAGLLGGLYEFPSVQGQLDKPQAEAALAELGFTGVEILKELSPAKHVFTHLLWRMTGWHAKAETAPEGTFAADAAGLRSHAFPSALRAYFLDALHLPACQAKGGDV